MGNTIPHRIPKSSLECFDPVTGKFSHELYHLLKRQRQMEASIVQLQQIIGSCESIADFETNDIADASQKNGKRKRRRKEKRRYRCPLDGTLKAFGPYQTPWYHDYVETPSVDCDIFQAKFRLRFRMAYESFQKHLKEVKESALFQQWSETTADASGQISSPIELLLLGTLRYLGRGWTLDDVEEATTISQETHRRFLHVYIYWGSTVFYDKYVSMPATSEEIAASSVEFFIAGLAGCIGSSDATHIGMNRCQYRLRQHHNSFKLPMPTRTYNITTNHRRRILSSTRGHPGRWNDKTLVLYDQLATDLRDGKRYDDLEFTLFETAEDGSIKSVKYTGAWLIVDNGYLAWPTHVPPFKTYAAYKELRFSKWVESMRKDVECTFGIMKGRFRILKTGIPLHGIEATDRIWLTCCSLHNFLLEEDGLDSGWDMNQYMTHHGHHDEDDSNCFLGHPLNSTQAELQLQFDTSGMGNGSDRTRRTTAFQAIPNGEGPPQVNEDGAIKVHTLTLQHFRAKLVQNFDILWQQEQIQWPSRTGLGSTPAIETEFDHNVDSTNV